MNSGHDRREKKCHIINTDLTTWNGFKKWRKQEKLFPSLGDRPSSKSILSASPVILLLHPPTYSLFNGHRSRRKFRLNGIKSIRRTCFEFIFYINYFMSDSYNYRHQVLHSSPTLCLMNESLRTSFPPSATLK